ncbi:Gfo/Idh/MocA family protein [Pectobacterium sp. A5351]|uniref:Gfo/Idh/MocA family protein n=1 Tax=Pectobacterium sp. A5351 TaxID=2914983 RepID=UPI00232EB430|nr:Gfo/Idh/MocA family oxidoreductase [Pectobacterium sp. A5351]WCG84652.1 Gfo/Idh/MocA family oxidoreductase [Pectobacterium sp. A5351]
MKSRLKLGMVGGGIGAYIGQVHRVAARIDDEFEWVAGALSSDSERARKSAQQLGFSPNRCYTDFNEMARLESERDDGIDAVVIVTPNHLHAPIAKAFLRAGIHIICDKPLAISLEEALELQKLAHASGKLFALTHTYSGYPMVRHARDLVLSGELGDIRYIHVEYVQDWLATPVEREGDRKAEWRTNPALAGPGGCLGDIGTHAYHLAAFVSGMLPTEITADLVTMVPGRTIDDHVQAMLRYDSGARGTLVASQIATGEGNALRLRVYGTKAAISFDQETPDFLWFTPLNSHTLRLTKGRAQSQAAVHATRFPAGHPEGYFEAFAQLYKDAALQINALKNGTTIPESSRMLTTVDDGVAGMKFIDAVLRSAAEDGKRVFI